LGIKHELWLLQQGRLPRVKTASKLLNGSPVADAAEPGAAMNAPGAPKSSAEGVPPEAAAAPAGAGEAPALPQASGNASPEGLHIAPLDVCPSNNGGGGGDASPMSHGGFGGVFNPFAGTADFMMSPLRRGLNPEPGQASPLAHSTFSPFGLPSVELRFTPTPPPQDAGDEVL
jgi:hypothetical protein